MKIIYMFHSIKDKSLLFDRKYSEMANHFGTGGEWTEELKSKEYGKRVLYDVCKKIRGMHDIGYCGCPERIAREVFEVKIHQKPYKVIFVIDQLDDNYIRFQVELESANIDGEIKARYDKNLEHLKIAIKNRLLQDWKTCIWIYDEQSELLCGDLYPQIFRIENRLKEYANRVFIGHLGVNWIDLHGLEKYKESADILSESFVSSVPEFRDISTTMFSITLETLAGIMFKGVVYNPEYKFNPDEIKKLEKIIKSNNELHPVKRTMK